MPRSISSHSGILTICVLMIGLNASAQQPVKERRYTTLELGPFELSPHAGVLLGGGDLIYDNLEHDVENGSMYGLGAAILLRFGVKKRGLIGFDCGFDRTVDERRIIKQEALISGTSDVYLRGKFLREDVLFLAPVIGSILNSGNWEFRGGIGPSWSKITTTLWDGYSRFLSYDRMVRGTSYIAMIGYRQISMRLEIHSWESAVMWFSTDDILSIDFRSMSIWWGISIGR